ncbi:MAG: hypothetical protein MZV70_46945 [Desulfobacterales bacterium]|nr:hypothetical protein [Desulfobacterales bacterium]
MAALTAPDDRTEVSPMYVTAEEFLDMLQAVRERYRGGGYNLEDPQVMHTLLMRDFPHVEGVVPPPSYETIRERYIPEEWRMAIPQPRHRGGPAWTAGTPEDEFATTDPVEEERQADACRPGQPARRPDLRHVLCGAAEQGYGFTDSHDHRKGDRACFPVVCHGKPTVPTSGLSRGQREGAGTPARHGAHAYSGSATGHTARRFPESSSHPEPHVHGE